MRGTTPREPPDFVAEVQLLDEKFLFSFDNPDKLRMQLSRIYLEEVSNVGPPNTSTAELERFIEERDWGSDHVWGWGQGEFLNTIADIKDDSTKWTVLRDYIY